MTVAVCIPVRGDAAGLAETIRTVRADDSAAHVVVAVDGPQPDVEAAARTAGADRVVVLASPGGSYAARNAAIDALPDEVDVVLFTDAGCRVRPGWIDAHREALAASSLSGGAVDRVRRARPSPAEYVDSIRNLDQRKYVEGDGFAATCNLAVRRDVLEVVRFDAALRSGGDREFCHRAARHGHAIVFTEDAVVEHDCRRTALEVWRKAKRVGAGVGHLPDGSRPVSLPRPRLHLGLARRARREGVSVRLPGALGIAVVDYLRTVHFVRAARRAGFRPGPPAPAVAIDVVVLLGTRWSQLEHHSTRWREVLAIWDRDPRIATITLVDFPRFRRRAAVAPSRRLASRAASWHPRLRVIDVTLGARDVPGPLDPLAWARTGRAVRRALPATGRPRLVVATNPLSAPLLGRLHPTWSLFDAVDDWRSYGGQAHRAARIDRGYRWVAAHPEVAVTAVNDRLVESLRAAYGITGVAISNGVDRERFAASRATERDHPPMAVYVGVVEDRVDVELLTHTAAGLRPGQLVVAGPMAETTRATLQAAGVHCLGRVDPSEVPELLGRASVGLLPHRPGPQTDSMDPMKLLEYLAAGLTVVATDVHLPPDVPREHLEIASDRDGFAATVAALLQEPPARHDGADVDHRRWEETAERLLAAATGAALRPDLHPRRLPA